ncbi:TPA: hypothetical protein DEG21_06035 [Patescibacteria group bacterium]|nr:hypothetical protein [Candidatus Gracilibacteria bacterium]
MSRNFILLKKEENLFIFKGYLDGKRVRVTIGKTQKGNYIPLEILKKESKAGYNIRDDYDASNIIDRTNREIIEDKYETLSLLV